MPIALVLLPFMTLVGHSSSAPKRTAIFAGGCFWGVEAVFEHLRGVRSVVSGFATPLVPSGDSTGSNHRGFAEAVRVTYDTTQITYEQLLQVFFLIAHDPTEVDRQGPDVGPRYRSMVLVDDPDQRRIALAYLDSLRKSRAYHAPIVTEVRALRSFQIAEEFHQDFVEHHPRDEYVLVNDLPKLEQLRRRFPELYRE